MSTEHSMSFVLTSAAVIGCLATGAAGQGDPGNIAVDFANPVIGTVVLDSPGTQAYQLYAPSPGGPIVVDGLLRLVDGAFMRYGGVIQNGGTIELGRDPVSGVIGSLSIPNSGAGINFQRVPGPRGILRLLGGTIYNPYNFSFPDEDVARVTNGPGHIITNSDGIPYPLNPPAFTGGLQGIQLTNHGDIFAERNGGVINLGLSIRTGGSAGIHTNAATGRIAAYDMGRINLDIRGGNGISPMPNRFINDGLLITDTPASGGTLPGPGGTIAISSLAREADPISGLTALPPGIFEGNNPQITNGGTLQLTELEFRNTGKTLEAGNGTIRLANLVTLVGGELSGNTGSRRVEIGFGRNNFSAVTFKGTLFASGLLRLRDGTTLGGASFRPITPAAGYTFALSEDLVFNSTGTYLGHFGFTTDSSLPVTARTLTLNSAITAPDSVSFSRLALAGSSKVFSPVVRIGPELNLSGYGGVLRPNSGSPLGGGQLRIENATYSAPLPGQLSYSNSTLVLDHSTLDLAGTTLAPAATFSSVRLENGAILRNGTLLSYPGGVTVANSRLESLSLQNTVAVENGVTLDRVLPGAASEFTGGDYTVTLATPWDLAGGTLRLNSSGTVSLNTLSIGQLLPTGGRIAADHLRLTGNLAASNLPDAQFAAGPSGQLHLTLGSYTSSEVNGIMTGNSSIASLDVSGGDLRLDYAPQQPGLGDTAILSLVGEYGISVDGRLTIEPVLTLRPSIFSGTGELSALRADAFSFGGGNLSGLRLAPRSAAARVDLAAGEVTTLAARETVTQFTGGTFTLEDPSFTFNPAGPASPPSTIALISRSANGQPAGSVQSDSTLVLSGIALSSAVTGSITPPGAGFVPLVLPDNAALGTLSAPNITLRHGTLTGTRYEKYLEEIFDQKGNSLGMQQVRRWTQAPVLSATGDINLGTPGELRLESGRYSTENIQYGRLILGPESTLTTRDGVARVYFPTWGYTGDPSAPEPDLTPLPDTESGLVFRADLGLPDYEFTFEGGRIEGITLKSLPSPYTYGSGRSAGLVSSRGAFAGNSQLIGTLDHATDAVTRFEAGYTFPLGAIDSYTTEYEPQLLRAADGLTGDDRRYGIEFAAVADSLTDIVTVPAPALFEESTRLKDNVTVTGIAGGPFARTRLVLPSDGTTFQSVANLFHSNGTLTFAGDLEVNVNGRLASEGRIVFQPGVLFTGSGKVAAANGFTLNGQTSTGNSPGVLTLEGDVEMGPASELIVDIGFMPAFSDQLAVSGSFTAGGKLTLRFTDGTNYLAPPFGANFISSLITAGSFAGSFARLEIQGIDPASFNLADLAKIGPASLFAGISTQPAPVPDLQFSSAGAVNRLTWDASAAGYRLQASDGLDGWSNLGSVITGAGNFEDTANDRYRRFYRLFKP